MDITITGRKALVTGASRGIGRDLAVLLAELGCHTALAGRDLGRLKETEELCKAKNSDGKTHVISRDLTEDKAAEQVIAETVKALGSLDILVNNAGTSLNSPIEETREEEFDNLMRVNARAPFFLCKAAIPHLEKSKAATIITISSVVGHKGYVHQAAYAASKHALTGFTKVLAREVQEKGIRVFLLSPGGVHTDMVQKMRPDLDTAGLIKTEDIADIVRFLVTHRGNAMIDELQIRRAGGTPWA